MNGWPFADAPNVAVLTVRDIVEGRAWIAHVSHDADDGTWQFHPAGPTPPDAADARVVSLRSLVERDPSLAAIADLPLGGRAWRASAQATWQRDVQ